MNRLTKMLTILDLRKKHLDSKAKEKVRVKWRLSYVRSAKLEGMNPVRVAQGRNIKRAVGEKPSLVFGYAG